MGIIAFDPLLGGQGKMRAMALFGMLGDLCGIIRLLPAEITGGYTQHHQAARTKTCP